MKYYIIQIIIFGDTVSNGRLKYIIAMKQIRLLMDSDLKEKAYVMGVGSVLSILKYDNSFSTIKASKDIVEEIMSTTENDFLRKLYAEITFILAQEYKKREDIEHYLEYKNKSINVYKSLHIDTVKESTPILSWLLPDFMHERIVANLLE